MQRQFTDERGATWQVWEIRPSNGGANVSATYKDGWLAFESDEAKDRETGNRLRLAPVPSDWESAPDATLRRYLARAVAAPPRYMDDDGRLPKIGPI
jgi:hypothetical protein